MTTGIYLGWTGFENLGDEAMLQVCRDRFSGINWITYYDWSSLPQATTFLNRVKEQPSHLFYTVKDELRHWHRSRAILARLRRFHDSNSRPVAMLGGGTIINHEWLKSYSIARSQCQTPIPTFGTGVSSPEFWSKQAGWRDSRTDWLPLLNELPLVGVRGPLSQASLEEVGVKNVVVSGDPAVMLHQPIHLETTSSRSKIGINCFSPAVSWGKPDNIIVELISFVREMHNRGFEPELVAVGPGDVDACNRVAANCPGFQLNIVACTSPRDYLYYIRSLTFVVTVRLHAAVLAAATNTPFLLVAYQPKCIDFTSGVGLNQFAIRADELNGDSTLLDRVIPLLDQTDGIRHELCDKMCRAKQTFSDYCSAIDHLLFSNRERLAASKIQ